MGVETDAYIKLKASDAGRWSPGMLQLFAEYAKHDNKYAPFMEEARVNRGLVFDWNQTVELVHEFGIVAPIVYALKPGESWLSSEERQQRRELSRVEKTYGNNTIIVMVADVESSNQWNVGPLRPNELRLFPQVVSRLRAEAMQKGNAERSEMLYRTLLIQEKMQQFIELRSIQT